MSMQCQIDPLCQESQNTQFKSLQLTNQWGMS